MQISTSAGSYSPTSVSPITATQGAALSQVAETSGSGNFPPIEAVVNATGSREIPGERAQPEIATPAGAFIYTNPSQNSTGNSNRSQNNDSQSENGTAENTSDSIGDNKRTEQQRQQAQEQQQQKQEQQDLAVIRELSQRDIEVRAHEQAHSAVGGQYAGSANYTYQRGPDGVSYAVGGEVSIDVGVVNGNPQATLEKMQIVLRAALAPAEPSTQDRQVAALASQQANQARAELASESRTASQTDNSEKESTTKSDNSSGTILNPAPNEAIASEESVSFALQNEKNAKEAPLLSDRIAKINEIILAISQNDTSKAAGQLLNDIA